MGVVSIRIPDDMQAELEAAGIVPSAVMKAALERELKAVKVRQAMEFLRANRFTPVEDTTKTIRDMRDNE